MPRRRSAKTLAGRVRRGPSGRIAPNPSTSVLKAQTAQRRRELAASAAVQRANQRAVIAARIAQGLTEAQQVIAERPEPTVDDLLMLSRQALDKAGELLGIQRPHGPTDAPAGRPSRRPRGRTQRRIVPRICQR